MLQRASNSKAKMGGGGGKFKKWILKL
jgi:hypothetical protein